VKQWLAVAKKAAFFVVFLLGLFGLNARIPAAPLPPSENPPSQTESLREDLGQSYDHMKGADGKRRVLRKTRALLLENLARRLEEARPRPSDSDQEASQGGQYFLGLRDLLARLQALGFRLLGRDLLMAEPLYQTGAGKVLKGLCHWTESQGPGLYLVVVGLRAGLVLRTPEQLFLWYSDGQSHRGKTPMEAMRQDPRLRGRQLLYGAAGRLLSEPMLKRWLNGEEFTSSLAALGPNARAQALMAPLERIMGPYGQGAKEPSEKAFISRHLQEIIRLLEEEREPSKPSGQRLLLLARAYAMLYAVDGPEAFKKTMDLLEQASQMTPQSSTPFLAKGGFLLRWGYAKPAIQAYWEALWRAKPEDMGPLLRGLAQAYLRSGNLLWARAAARQLQSLDPHDSGELAKEVETQVRKDGPGLPEVTIQFAPEGVRYTNSSLGYSFLIPRGWTLAEQMRDPKGRHPDRESFLLLLPVPETAPLGTPRDTLSLTVVKTATPEAARKMADQALREIKTRASLSEEGPDGTLRYEREGKRGLLKGIVRAVPFKGGLYIVHLGAGLDTFQEAEHALEAWSKGLRFEAADASNTKVHGHQGPRGGPLA